MHSRAVCYSGPHMSTLLLTIIMLFQRQVVSAYALSRDDLPREVHRAVAEWPLRVVESGPVSYVERMKGQLEVAGNYGLWPEPLRAVVPDGDISRVGRGIYDQPSYLQIKNGDYLAAVIETPGWFAGPYIVWIRPDLNGVLP